MRVSYEWTWRDAAPPERLWPMISDTNRINRAVGLSAWSFETKPAAGGGIVREGRTRAFGLNISWDELPYEWRAPEQLGVERRYHSGPYSRIVITVTLEREGAGTRLTHRLDVDCRGPLGLVASWVQLGWSTRRGFDRIYRRIFAAAAVPPGPEPFREPPPPLSAAATERLDAVLARLREHHPSDMVERLGRLVREGGELELQRLRPFALARLWDADRMEVLKLCLRATKLGLLQMAWRILCPHCRGSRNSHALAELSSAAHCESCNFDFEADFSRHLEVVFKPSEQIREVHAADYCIGGPGSTPHVVLQKRVAAGTSAALPMAVPAGAYRLRSPHGGGMLHVAIEDGGPLAFVRRLSAHDEDTTLAPGGRIEFLNDTDHEALAIVELREWEQDAATAAIVTTCQDFRDMFSNEAIARGEEFRVALIALMFTDLRGSTAMYERVGDVPAFAVVREHFALLEQAIGANKGAVVKTIGDAVMAAFTDAADAVAAARDIQRAFGGALAGGERLTVRIGVHAGPCVAVNLNDRVDYFGTTVNVAARLEGQSQGGDVVLLASLAEDPGVRRMLDSLAPEREALRVKLKGLRDDIEIVRLRFRAEPGDR